MKCEIIILTNIESVLFSTSQNRWNRYYLNTKVIRVALAAKGIVRFMSDATNREKIE